MTSAVEHKAVLDTCAFLAAEEGFEITYLDPDAHGRIEVEAVRDVLRPDTLMVSIMHVNNELGTVNDIAAMGALCRENQVLLHVDAAQSFGKLPIDVRLMKIDMFVDICA